MPKEIIRPLEMGCKDHKYCCKSCDDYSKKGSCLFITRLVKSKVLSTKDSDFENEEGIFLNATDRDLIGCIGCLSHSSLRQNHNLIFKISSLLKNRSLIQLFFVPTIWSIICLGIPVLVIGPYLQLYPLTFGRIAIVVLFGFCIGGLTCIFAIDKQTKPEERNEATK